MPGTNLTRDEAATRASLLDVTSYSIDLDLTTSDTTFGSTTTIVFTLPRARARRPSPTWSARRSTRSRSTASPSTPSAYADSRIALTGLAADNTLVVEGRLHLLAAPARGCTASSTRPTTGSTSTRSSRCPTPAASTPPSSSPTSRRRSRSRHRARRTGRSSPTPRPPSRRTLGDGKAGLALPEPRSRCRPTSPRWSPASTTRSATPTTASTARSRSGLFCRQSLVEHLDADELIKVTKQGFEFFEEAFGYPYPFGKYDQLFVPEYNMGAMENAGVRDLPRRVPPAQPPGPLVLRVPRRGDPPRDGAHVVRRPRDDEVVGRPLAQRVVRRVGLLPRGGRGHRVHRGLDRLHQRPQELGLPPGPAALDPPDRGGQLRPAGGRGQLRRHHLRQGRLGAQAAGRVGRPGGLPRGPARLLRGLRVRQHRVQGPADGPGEGLRPRAGVVGAGVAADLRRQHAGAASSSSTTTAPTRRSPSCRPPRADYPTLRRHRLGIGLYDKVDGRLVRRTSLEIDVEGELTEVARAGRRRSSPTCCCSTTATSPTPRSASTSARSTRWSPASRRSTTRWPARCAGARPGT